MFGLFKKKSPADQLRSQYEQLLKEAFRLSKIDRMASDQKYSEANEIMKKIEALEGA